jgi:hypothetical protein
VEKRNGRTEEHPPRQTNETEGSEEAHTEDKSAENWGRLGYEDVDDNLLCEALLILEDYQPEEN